VGAECAEACPYDAFEWNDGGALVITDRCTGCGDCVPACPYDAVQRVPRHNQTHNPLKLLLRTMQRARRAVRPVIPLEPVEYTHRADKCDLCHSYDDMACVSQCPSGALRLVPVEEVLPL
jgi:Fe-S-cluster-containing hydrogenase component 2